MNDIWILGATGRVGHAVAAQLATANCTTVLVGRDAQRLHAAAATIGHNARIVVAESTEAIVRELSRSHPAVVINTIGPFTNTALPIASACATGTHYVDVSNELPAIKAVFNLHSEAVSTGRTCIAGAGFGVLATESVVLKLCEGQPPAKFVRVDAMPMVVAEAGTIGEALASTIIDGLAFGGYRYANGRLERSPTFGEIETVSLPDGSTVKTGSVPTGDLEAAYRVSGAPSAVAASSMMPSAPVRALIPVVMALMKVKAIREFAKRRIAAIEVKPPRKSRPDARAFSWTHARVEWASGNCREGWLRLGDGMAFTVAATAAIALRLARNEGKAGAYTPGALFGSELAVELGGQFFLDPPAQ